MIIAHVRRVIAGWLGIGALFGVVLQRVGHDQRLLIMDGVGAEGPVPGCLGCIEADPTFEPLSITINQRNESGGCAANPGGQAGQVIVLLFGKRIEYVAGA